MADKIEIKFNIPELTILIRAADHLRDAYSVADNPQMLQLLQILKKYVIN